MTLRKGRRASSAGADPHAYAGRPAEYARAVLGVSTLTPEQLRILDAVHRPPYKVLVPSATNVGKTFVMAVLASYWMDSYDPGVVLTTAPTNREVRDLLWAEIRLQRGRAGLPMPGSGPVMPFWGDSPDHYAKGFASKRGELFKGRHRLRTLYLFDEGEEIAPPYYTYTKTMFDPSEGHVWVVCYNPRTTTSAAYQENLACAEADGTPRWTLIRLSALGHPNVLSQLRGGGKTVRGAVSLEQVNQAVEEWCEPVRPGEERPADVQWPPEWHRLEAAPHEGPRWFRPGPEFQCCVLGLEPDTGDGVWSPAVWEACFGAVTALPAGALPVIGCDCATGKGDDYMAVHGRWGGESLHHETSNTMDPERIAFRLKAVCSWLAEFATARRDRAARPVGPKEIPVNIDDDGTGNAVGAFLRAEGYRVAQIGAGTKAADEEKYPNKRSELWFRGVERARAGLVNLSRLDARTRARLRQQLLAPAWELDGAGRRKVEPKDETKEKIGRSPDDADAFNLSQYEPPASAYTAHAKAPPQGKPEEAGGWGAHGGGGQKVGGHFGHRR